MKPATAGLVLAGLGLTGVAIAGVVLHRQGQRRLAGAGLGRTLALEATSTAKRGKNGKGGLRVHKVTSIHERMAVLQDLTHRSAQDPSMRKLALQITHDCHDRDGVCELRKIYDWTKAHIRYSGDLGPLKQGRNGPVEGVDVFQTAARTVEYGAGDCDDHSILNATLAAHNGFTVKYRVTSPTRGSQEDWAHIYAMAGLPKMRPRRFVALDTTLPGNRWFGREAPFGKKKDYDA